MRTLSAVHGRPDPGSVKKLLKNCGLTVLKAEDIGKNVLRARELVTDSDLFEKAIQHSVREEYTEGLDVFLPLLRREFWLKGTELYEYLESGKVAYWSWALQKPND
jgi:hypothetical protein